MSWVLFRVAVVWGCLVFWRVELCICADAVNALTEGLCEEGREAVCECVCVQEL
jgi:hypothetical protein